MECTIFLIIGYVRKHLDLTETEIACFQDTLYMYAENSKDLSDLIKKSVSDYPEIIKERGKV